MPDFIIGLTECRDDCLCQLIDRRCAAAAEVNYLPLCRGRRQRARPAVDNVFDKNEVACLLAVAEDRDRLVA